MAFPPVPFQEWFLRQTSTGNAALNAYVARVKADGGVVEAIGCVPLGVWDWAAPSFVGLLDLYPNAAAAYSLRKLRAAYSGAAVRVRESGGNTEADIGFTSAGELDTSALLAHCGANDGFVTVWYDQSLSNDATQTTAANQPKIVSAGSLVTENGKAALEFGEPNSLVLSSAILPLTTFTVAKNNQITKAIHYILFNDTSVKGYFYGGSFAGVNGLGVFDGSVKSITGEDTNRHLGYFYYNGTQFEVAKDGESATALAAGSNFNIERIGRTSNDLSINGPVQELILYSSDQSANRTGIETNINNFYSIYP